MYFFANIKRVRCSEMKPFRKCSSRFDVYDVLCWKWTYPFQTSLGFTTQADGGVCRLLRVRALLWTKLIVGGCIWWRLLFLGDDDKWNLVFSHPSEETVSLLIAIVKPFRSIWMKEFSFIKLNFSTSISVNFIYLANIYTHHFIYRHL